MPGTITGGGRSVSSKVPVALSTSVSNWVRGSEEENEAHGSINVKPIAPELHWTHKSSLDLIDGKAPSPHLAVDHRVHITVKRDRF